MAFGGKSWTFTLHSQNYERVYVAHFCSWINILRLFILVATITLPFLLSFSTNIFWTKFSAYQEHPLVSYNYKLYASALFSKLDGAGAVLSQEQYQYSTVKAVRDNAENLLSTPAIESTSMRNSDDKDKNDRINVTMRIRKPQDGLVLSRLDVIAGLSYQTFETVKLKMESLAIVSVSEPDAFADVSLAKVKAVGELQLKQLYPIAASKGDTRDLYDDDFFSYLEFTSLERFVYNYLTQRNETTAFDYTLYPSYGPASLPYIDVELVLIIPSHQNIFYTPLVFQVLKMAWVQYFSLLVLVYVVIYWGFLGFVVKNKVFDSVEVNKVDVYQALKKKRL